MQQQSCARCVEARSMFLAQKEMADAPSGCVATTTRRYAAATHQQVNTLTVLAVEATE